MPQLSDRIEAMIAAGKLGPGSRLPAERQLASEFGVSRSRLREAIKQLASRGLLVSRQGGGTYVSSPGDVEPVRAALLSLAPLARSEAGYWRDVMEIRKSLEGDAAGFAALRSDNEDKERISVAYEVLAEALHAPELQWEAAQAPLALATLDARFHMAIARAAHNAVLYQLMTGLGKLVESSISGTLAHLYRLPGVAADLDEQHRRIMAAILAGRADDARAAATEHLLFVEDRLECIEQDAARQSRSSLALQHISTMKEALS
ncbi:GntR family transcriptional regulator [Acidiphilium multivorum]|uniref:GntR family transcriptional regulator n=1 Tax=Acidiphilium multivorum TaxID=62140 RepID=UPI0039C90DB4